MDAAELVEQVWTTGPSFLVAWAAALTALVVSGALVPPGSRFTTNHRTRSTSGRTPARRFAAITTRVVGAGVPAASVGPHRAQ